MERRDTVHSVAQPLIEDGYRTAHILGNSRDVLNAKTLSSDPETTRESE